MSIVSRAKKIIDGAIGELRNLAADALKDDNYDDLIKIARLADELSKLTGSSKTSTDEARVAPVPVKPRTTPSRRKSRRGYPRFERDGDKIVKIGWSKKSKKEYEHRAPYGVATALLAAVREKVSDGELFTAADILPLADYPDYQAYLALKWLHTEGVVTKQGRDKYAVLPDESADSIDLRWHALPKCGITLV